MKKLLLLTFMMLGCGQSVTVNTNDDRVSELERRMYLSEQLQELNMELSKANEARIEALEARDEALSAELSSEVELLNIKIDLINGSLDALDEQASALEDMIESSQEDIGSLEDAVSSLIEQVDSLSEQIALINDYLEGLEESGGSVVITTYSSNSCKKLEGTSYWMKSGSSKATIYDDNDCHSSDKVADLSSSSPLFWLTPSSFAAYDNSNGLKLVSIE